MLKIGHRGAAGHAPENTIKSFEKALELGVDAIEFDVRQGTDGLVVFHDPDLKRLTNGADDRPIRYLLETEFVQIFGEPIAMFSEVLYRFGKRTILNIELKEEKLAERVLRMVRESGLVDRVIVSAFDDNDNKPGDSSSWVDLLWMKRKESKLKIALLVERPDNIQRALSVAKAYPVHAVCLPDQLMDIRLVWPVRLIDNLNLFVWTVDEVERMKYLKAMGVDGIFSNYPDRFKEAGIA